MTTDYQWREVHSLTLDEWPLSDDADGQRTANNLAPLNRYWFRRALEDGTQRYVLMEYEGEYDLE